MARDGLVARRRQLGLSQADLAARINVAVSTVARVERGEQTPQAYNRRRWAEALEASLGELDRLLAGDEAVAGRWGWTTVEAPDLGDVEAIELIRRVEASDAGRATLDALERGVDRLCRSYTNTPPADLLEPLRAYRSYVVQLLDGHVTLAQRRDLMVLAGWLSLMTAICAIDVHRYRTAASNLDAARALGHEAGYPTLAAWAAETEAWQAVTDGRHDVAARLCRAGRDLAPADTSVHVQLSVQEARASARLGLTAETHQLLDDAATALDRMPAPEHPEHHFVFDPRKLIGYTATTLAWLDDDKALAEDYARQAVAQYDVGAADGRWLRRLAAARVDLALVLARGDQPAEAGQLGGLAIASGRMVPSNLWRLDELDREMTGRYGRTAEVDEFHDVYLDARQAMVALPRGS
jgi:transcriptional regulator with XRE-family HTH domain